MIAEPVLTWNLFLTAVIVPIGIWWLDKREKDRWTGWKAYHDLKEKMQEETKVKVETHMTCMRTQVQDLREKKVDKEEYEKHHKEVWARVNDHGHKIKCNGKECKEVEIGKVIITGE